MAKQTIRRRILHTLKDLTNWLDIKSTHSAFSGESLGSGVLGLNGRKISVSTFFTVYRSDGDVYAVIRELSENVGMEGFTWVNTNDATAEPDAGEVQAAEDILNENKTFRRWKSELIQTVEIAGNAYIQVQMGAGTGKATGLNFIDPRTISVVTDRHGTVLKWIQKVKGTTVEFTPEEIAHFIIQRDPNSPVFGLSPLEPIFWEVRTDQQAMVSNFVFFENDAIPAAHYVIDDELSDTEQTRIAEKLREHLKGANNRHKSLALKGLKEIKQLSVSNKDMEFHVLRRFSTEKVCAAYGVPKSILNYTEAVNLATAEEQTKKFWQGTILPLEESLAEFINVTLLPKLGIQNIKLVFNPKTFENQKWNEASTRADLATGVLTINEVRKLRGLEPFENSAEGEFVDKPMIYNGVSVVPVEDVGVDLGEFGEADTIDAAAKEIQKINEASDAYEYGRNKSNKNQ